MKTHVFSAVIERQMWSRIRSASFWIGATTPVLVIGFLLYQTGIATGDPAPTLFLAVLSALWTGGSSCVREIVDERKLVQREPHLSMLAYGLAKIAYAAIVAAGQSLALSVFLLYSGVVMAPAVSLVAILFLTAFSGALLALILSAFCDEPATALAWFPLLLVPQVIFGGFLFVYSEMEPIIVSDAGLVLPMPAELTRQPVEGVMLRAAGALAVSRWALEALAAETIGGDLEDPDRLDNAVQVANAIPLTFARDPVSDHLRERVDARWIGSGAPFPAIAVRSWLYFMVLLVFALGQAALLILLLPLRDPRRV